MARRPSIAQPGALTADEVYARLAVRYALPEWGLFRQVCEAGTGGARYADAVAMNLFPSRGMEVEGFEIKVSRGDWLREKRAPEKADAIARFCDRWWIVAGAQDIVGVGELPPTWGLILPRGDGLVTKVQAPKLEPEPLSRGFVATIARRMQADDRFSWDSQIANAVREAKRDAQAEHEKELAKALEPTRRFEEATGLQIGDGSWSADRAAEIGRAVRLFLDGKAHVDSLRRDLEWKRKSLRKVMAELDEFLGPQDVDEDRGAAALAAGEGT